MQVSQAEAGPTLPHPRLGQPEQGTGWLIGGQKEHLGAVEGGLEPETSQISEGREQKRWLLECVID